MVGLASMSTIDGHERVQPCDGEVVGLSWVGVGVIGDSDVDAGFQAGQ